MPTTELDELVRFLRSAAEVRRDSARAYYELANQCKRTAAEYDAKANHYETMAD